MPVNIEKERSSLRSLLTGWGLQEIITYSLISEGMKQTSEKNGKKNFYKLNFPKNENYQYYRQEVFPSHLLVIKNNFLHQNKDLFFFEISSVYNQNSTEELLTISGTGSLLTQPVHKLSLELDFYWLKGIIENLLGYWWEEKEINFLPQKNSFSSFSAEIFIGEKKIGFCSKISSDLANYYSINQSIFVAEISLSKMFNLASSFSNFEFHYKPISNYPTSEKDLSFFFPEKINCKEVIEKIKLIGGEKLQEIKIIDIYRNDIMIEKNEKSITFRLIFQSNSKTLSKQELILIMERVTTDVKKFFQGKLR